MKTLTLSLLALLTAGMVGGCDNALDVPEQNTDPAPNGDGGIGTNNGTDPDLSLCDPANTCAAKIAAGEAAACVADFEYGTNQAGNSESGYNHHVGFYGYNDKTEGAVQIPERNMDGTEPATELASCDPNSRYVLHLQAHGFTDWGAGIGLDWSGSEADRNPNCDVEGALDCWELFREDDKFLLTTAEADPRCQEPNAEAKLDCLTKGKFTKTPRDLSEYLGLGFWVLATPDNMMSKIKITLPIPDTVRFYGECNDDDGDNKANDCFNDYYAEVKLNPADAGKWVYKEIYFDDTTWNQWWGLQLGTLGYSTFPKDKSMGIKFQVDTPVQGEEISFTDLYFDDIMLIK